MRIKSQENSAFELRVLGYQFPEVPDNEYDANWLRVFIQVQVPRGSWKSVDSCLLTWEVERLANWFDALASDHPTDAEVDFVEPNLAFRASTTGGSGFAIQVCFRLECKPPWLGRDVDEFLSDFQLTHHDLRDAAESLRSELKQFPKRKPKA